jgi:hypothetical protein
MTSRVSSIWLTASNAKQCREGRNFTRSRYDADNVPISGGLGNIPKVYKTRPCERVLKMLDELDISFHSPPFPQLYIRRLKIHHRADQR